MGDLTLAQMYQLAPTQLDKGVIRAIQDESELADSLTYETIQANTVRTYRSGEMREVKWRRLNQPFDHVVQGQPEPIDAGMFSFGNTIDVDYRMKEDKSPKIIDPEADQIEQTITAMARGFNTKWVNNTPMDDPDALIGIKYIIDKEFPGQKICANPAGNAVLDLSPTGANYATNISIFFRMLDEAFALIHGGKPNLAVCNKQFLTNFKALCRDSGYLKTTEDSLGRSFIDYNGVKFIDAGFMVNDTDQIIKNNELYTGVEDASGNATSIYLARIDKQHYQPFQFAPLTTDHIGKLQDGVNYRTVVKWDIGHIVTHPRSLARLTGLKF